MKVPHGSEILDVASGSGILSCLLQSKGYYNIGDKRFIEKINLKMKVQGLIFIIRD